MLQIQSPLKLFVLSFILGTGLFAHAGGEVIYGVPFGRKKSAGCADNFEKLVDRSGRSDADTELIFERLLDVIRQSDTYRRLGDHRGVHTWYVKSTRTAIVSLVRGPEETCYLVVESPEFPKSFLVGTFERQQLLMVALTLRLNGDEPDITPGRARAWGDLDGIVL